MEEQNNDNRNIINQQNALLQQRFQIFPADMLIGSGNFEQFQIQHQQSLNQIRIGEDGDEEVKIELNANNLLQPIQIDFDDRPIHDYFPDQQQIFFNDLQMDNMPQRVCTTSTIEEDSTPRSIPNEHNPSFSDDDYIHNNMQYQHYQINYKNRLLMKGITWNRDSHGLFDYETRHPNKKDLLTQTEAKMIRVGPDLQLIGTDEQLTENAQLLLTIRKLKNNYFLEPPQITKKEELRPRQQENNEDQVALAQNIFNERMYLVDYQLKKHDVIKLGRVQFKVKYIRINAIEQEKEKKKRRKLKRQQQNKNGNITVEEAAQNDHSIGDKNLGALLLNNNHPDEDSFALNNYISGEQSIIPIPPRAVNSDRPVFQMGPDILGGNGGIGQGLGLERHPENDVINLDDEDSESDFEALEGEENFLEVEHVPETVKKLEKKKKANVLQKQGSEQPKSKVDPLSPGLITNPQIEQSQKGSEEISPFSKLVNNSNIISPIQKHSQNILAINPIAVVPINPYEQIPAYDISHNPAIQEVIQQKKDEEEKLAIEIHEQAITKMDPNEQNDFDQEEVVSSLNKELPFCRFCWVNESTVINPLLSSCRCRGGVQFIHYLCLKEWLKTKNSCKQSMNISSYFWKAFECEICKTPYPYVFKAGGRKYHLIDLNKPQGGNYIILESLSLESNTSRMVHLICPSMGSNTFKMGRGHDSEIRINDISVSRCHAEIKYEKNAFFLADNASKFGTLVLIRKQLKLSPQYHKSVQVGRTVINFAVKQCPIKEYKMSEHIKGNIKRTFSLEKQKGELKKLYQNMNNAEQYIMKQRAEHARLTRTDNFHNRNNYYRRILQNVHEEEIKIELSQNEDEERGGNIQGLRLDDDEYKEEENNDEIYINNNLMNNQIDLIGNLNALQMNRIEMMLRQSNNNQNQNQNSINDGQLAGPRIQSLQNLNMASSSQHNNQYNNASIQLAQQSAQQQQVQQENGVVILQQINQHLQPLAIAQFSISQQLNQQFENGDIWLIPEELNDGEINPDQKFQQFMVFKD